MLPIIVSTSTVSERDTTRRYMTDQITETELKNAAWYYPEPKEKAKNIKDYVAFCKFHAKRRFNYLCAG